MNTVYIINILGATEVFYHLEDAIDFINNVIIKSNIHPYIVPSYELQRNFDYLEDSEVSIPRDLEIIKDFLTEDFENHYINISFEGHLFTGTIRQKRIYKGANNDINN